MEFINEPGRVYALDGDGRLLAEITFPASGGVATINHTFVDASLRGQNVADALVRAALEQIHANGLTVKATCSYAAAWLSKHPELA